MVYATVALVTIALIDRGAMRLYMDPGQYGWLYLHLTVPLMLILHDAYFYWVHRLMHHPRIHRVHRLHPCRARQPRGPRTVSPSGRRSR